ncbi:tail fiber assembly protein [Shewanella sp. ZOR0012]|uniref:tail fiber assembly protein n=1 Tax=Shewanella sp. ZOR0012 TaxID=1339231 RepID=UPI0018CF94CB|nr:tail fiber assembly protein [Shewanella sp. ZOR0012]
MEHIIPLEELIKMTWFSVRAKRDKMISETDWTQMSDSPLSVDKIEEFKVYRQALRDLPQSTDNPDEIVWPVKPE